MAQRRRRHGSAMPPAPAKNPRERDLLAALETARIKDRESGNGMLVVIVPLGELVDLPGTLRQMAATIEADLASNDG